MKPFQLLGMDYIGLLSESNDYHYILHIINYFSQFSITFSSTNNIKNETIYALQETFNQYTTSVTIYLDIGMHFNNSEVHTFLKRNSITLLHSPSRAHKFIRMVKKGNDLLQQTIKKFTELQIDQFMREYASFRESWSEQLAQTTSNMNIRFIVHLEYSLKEILFGINLPDLFKLENVYLQSHCASLLTWITDSQFDLPQKEEMMQLVWDFMVRRDEKCEEAAENDSIW